MVWTAFEIAINCVQGLLILMFVKQCFAYEKQHPVADAALESYGAEAVYMTRALTPVL